MTFNQKRWLKRALSKLRRKYASLLVLDEKRFRRAWRYNWLESEKAKGLLLRRRGLPRPAAFLPHFS